MSRAEKRKNSRGKKGLIIGLGLVAVVIVGGYSIRSVHYSQRFLPNTEASGVDISNLTVDEANQKLEKELSDTAFMIKIDGKNWKEINRDDVGWKSDYTSDLQNIKSEQNPFSWGTQLVSAASTTDLENTTVDSDQLNAVAAVVRNDIQATNESRTPSTDATINQNDSGDFEIVAEKQGTQIDVDKAAKAFESAVESGKSTIDFSNYYTKPAVTSNSTKLKNTLSSIDKIANVKATYSINGESIQIPSESIKSWLTTDEAGNATLDQEQVTNYVTELGNKYNTSTNPTKFTSTRRGEVEVPAGTYGWTIDTEAEVTALTDQILAGESFTRSPKTNGSTTADHKLIDNTYVEVDLENQHMWFYQNGELKLETDIVSGKPTTPTPAGVNYIWSMETNTTLRGTNDDGSKYASPVSYWMPIDWTGVGIHDSDWQSAYGGSRWLTYGSHGCINTPPGVMSQLFGMVSVGVPVLVF
ncbi:MULTISPECIES: L,D-transpeptidase family protein [Enterococcus]|uniref:L,D-transpeptidase family protein n=1 Tax=Enterococcus sp. AZ103 TaxID=2774628 RepID=UPI003F24B1C8